MEIQTSKLAEGKPTNSMKQPKWLFYQRSFFCHKQLKRASPVNLEPVKMSTQEIIVITASGHRGFSFWAGIFSLDVVLDTLSSPSNWFSLSWARLKLGASCCFCRYKALKADWNMSHGKVTGEFSCTRLRFNEKTHHHLWYKTTNHFISYGSHRRNMYVL